MLFQLISSYFDLLASTDTYVQSWHIVIFRHCSFCLHNLLTASVCRSFPFLSISLSFSLSLSLFLSLSLTLSSYLCLCGCKCQFDYLSVCLSLVLSVFHFYITSLSVCLRTSILSSPPSLFLVSLSHAFILNFHFHIPKGEPKWFFFLLVNR